MQKQKKFKILLIAFFLIFNLCIISTIAFSCNICDHPQDPMVFNQAYTSVSAIGLNLTLNFSQDHYYQTLAIDSLGYWIAYDCFSFSNNLNSTHYNIFINDSFNMISSFSDYDLETKCLESGSSLIPGNITIPPTTINQGASLWVWFPPWIYVVILILAFILWLVFMYYGFYVYAGILAIMFGFIMLLSGILWIISISVIIGGIAVLFIPEEFSFRRK